MINEAAIVTTMIERIKTLEGFSLQSLIPLGKNKAAKNLIRDLRDHVTYPPELIRELNSYGKKFSEELKNYDDRILYNWDGYDDEEKKELLCMANAESVKVLGYGLQTSRIEFVDLGNDPDNPELELMGQMETREENGVTTHVVQLSNKLLRQSITEALGVTAHEQAHSLVSQYCEQANDITQGKSGRAWSQHGDNVKFYLNPEEALVRAFETNVMECFAPNSAAAKRQREVHFQKPGYVHMASARQYFDLIRA